MEEQKTFNVNVNVNNVVSIQLKLKEEMNIAEFLGVVEVVKKIDTYSFAQKRTVKELRPYKGRKNGVFKLMNKEQIASTVEKFMNSTAKEKKVIAEDLDVDFDRLQRAVYYHNAKR